MHRHTSIAVITGTIGSETLRETIESVRRQTIPVQHWIVIDGHEYDHGTRRMLEKMPMNTNPYYVQHIVTLPENTGGSGYVCHRINGSFPWLVNADYVCYLDEDNTFEPTHLQCLLESIVKTPGARWAYSFRKIMDADGTVICEDSCESLGCVSHTVLSMDDRLIDTNCYMLERTLAIQISPLWNVKARQDGKLEADRHVCRVLLEQEPLHGISKCSSVRYRVCGRPDSVRPDFFLEGNAILGKGVGGYDGRKETLYLFHFDPQRTALYCHGDPPTNPLAEWCPGMWHDLVAEYNLVDGYANMNFLPWNAKCLISMCSPETLPLKLFRMRKDLFKILYTAEGPNIRHREQWSSEFLKQHFDVVLTYWEPLLSDPQVTTVLCPHNSRFLEFPTHAGLLRENRGDGSKRIVMVLERRDFRAEYEINGTRLRCLDYLREQYVAGLGNISVYGNGWADYCATHPETTLGYSMPRDNDVHTPIDHYVNGDFALIVENCDATGYISEKFGDALIAGAIPLYYGNPSKDFPLPENCYIDIRQFQCGNDLQRFIDSLQTEDIDRYKRAIKKVRQDYLQSRGRARIGRAVRDAIDRHYTVGMYSQ